MSCIGRFSLVDMLIFSHRNRRRIRFLWSFTLIGLIFLQLNLLFWFCRPYCLDVLPHCSHDKKILYLFSKFRSLIKFQKMIKIAT